MVLLFIQLYYSIFQGTWSSITWNSISNNLKPFINGIGTFLTSIFGDTQTMDTLGDILFINGTKDALFMFISLILALITSICIVYACGKVLKRIFGVFFLTGR